MTTLDRITSELPVSLRTHNIAVMIRDGKPGKTAICKEKHLPFITRRQHEHPTPRAGSAG